MRVTRKMTLEGAGGILYGNVLQSVDTKALRSVWPKFGGCPVFLDLQHALDEIFASIAPTDEADRTLLER